MQVLDKIKELNTPVSNAYFSIHSEWVRHNIYSKMIESIWQIHKDYSFPEDTKKERTQNHFS